MAGNIGGCNPFWKNYYGRPDDAREIALGATRSYLRSMNIDPATCSADDAAKALDDLQRIDPNTKAAIFAQYASLTQLRKFRKDWEQWRKKFNQDHPTTG